MRDKIIEILLDNADRLSKAGWGDKGWREEYNDVADEILALHFSCPSCECPKCNGVEETWYEEYLERRAVETDYLEGCFEKPDPLAKN